MMTDRQNTENDSQELKRYLFYEASEAERGRLEDRFFDDDRLFYELLDLENDLTDRYARNELDETDRKRYAESLKRSPERRARLANANALQSFIAEEESKTPAPIVEKNPNFWGKISAFFNLNAVNFRSAAVAALLFLLLAGISFLIYERRRDAQELARLREAENQRTAELQQQEQTMREQIKTIEEREKNLQTELGTTRGQTEILTEQLTREQTEKARLERELEILKREKSNRPPEVQTPPSPLIATVILAPIGGKGGGNDAAIIRINQNTSTVSATLQIPKDSTAETVSVRLNSATLAENLKVSQTRSGNKFVRVSFPAKNLAADKENLLTVNAADGSRYNYVLRRQK